MRGASRASLAELKERLAAELPEPTRADETASQVARTAAALGEELFAFVHLLDREHGLRRTLSDPARSADQKAALVRALLEGKVAAAAAELAAAAAALRWSRPRDLTDAVEQLAVMAHLISAEAQGKLDDLEDELFRFGRVVAAEPRLRGALSDPSAAPERKRALLAELLEAKVTEPTLRLITEAAQYPRGRSLDRSLDEYARLAAERRQRLVAVVRTAAALTDAQRSRLAAALAETYGHEVHLNVVLDPGVIGGLSVEVGGEVIDATVASRLKTLRRR